MKERKPYKIVGVYDSETTNCKVDGVIKAFPMLHQLGMLDDIALIDITPENVEDHVSLSLYRHAIDLYAELDELVSSTFDYVPVICCHNLSFDMYGLSQWLNRHDVSVLAKSAKKPITFTIYGEQKEPKLVIWDTLVFSQQSLSRMGDDCGYFKAVGEWDYSLIRTPETPLTDDEIDYAKKDVYALFVWLAWWLRRNPDIKPERLALNVVTKTGVVRERRRVRFDSLKGNGFKNNVGRYWLYINRTQAPKSDDELYTMQAATRGGFTFCASASASIPFDLDETRSIYAFDATSMHPAEMVSHKYPIDFKAVKPLILDKAFEVVSKIKPERLLENWAKPFPAAFYGCFEFVNLRPKKGSMFEQFGIFPLASARYKQVSDIYDDENGDKNAHEQNRALLGYTDCAVNARCEFGKLVSADIARLFITELTGWEICQCYDFDSVKAISGYYTGRFVRPSDMAVISVMQFYKAKNLFKAAREEYFQSGTISNGEELLKVGIPENTVNTMVSGTLSDNDVNATYLALKADLNALFGIEASNEYRRTTELTSSGIVFAGEFGIQNKPKNPKAWYQFGQRIVGWSRIAQIMTMLLCRPHIETVVNGDTDSIKLLAKCENYANICGQLDKFAVALDKAKEHVCARVKRGYPTQYDPLDGIGHYVFEFEAKQFCASWNKAYCIREYDKRDGEYHFLFTLAGVPTKRRVSKNSCFIGVNGYADRLYRMGYSFADVCNLLLGYNVTIAHDLIKMNGRKFPEWGATFFNRVTDYQGITTTVAEPEALALYPMGKTINNTLTAENGINCSIASRNNALINIRDVIVHAHGITEIEGLFNG